MNLEGESHWIYYMYEFTGKQYVLLILSDVGLSNT